MSAQDKGSKAAKKAAGTPLFEWISAAIGAMITIVLLGFIIAEAMRTDAGMPPILDVRPAGVTTNNGLYVVEVTVANRSGQTAAAVTVEGELSQNGTSVQKSSVTMSYVPGNSERRAGLIFTRDPRRLQLEVRATGYEKP